MRYLQISVSEPIGLFYTQPSMWTDLQILAEASVGAPQSRTVGFRDIRQLYRILRYSVIKSPNGNCIKVRTCGSVGDSIGDSSVDDKMEILLEIEWRVYWRFHYNL
jgi:hypothetical protein